MLARSIVIYLCFFSNVSIARQQTFKNLVFEGAGIRGIAYAGVVEQFEKAGVLDSIEKVGGTSAGAIVALLISLGYTATEITSIISETNFSRFNDGQFIFIGGIHRLNKYYGWYKGERFLKWMDDLIEKKTGNPDITFADLHNKGFKDLYTTATCLNRQKMIILSNETYPRMRIKDAVRISMSIPLYFKAVFVDSLGAIVKKPGTRKDLDIMVDGGIIGNFPINLFDTVIHDSSGRIFRKINPATIGIRIDSDEQISNDLKVKELASIPISNLKDYLNAFYILVIENLNRNQLIPADWDRTIAVSSIDIGPQIKKLSSQQKNELIESGRKSAMKYLKKN
jgi:NTE family protein